MTKLSVNINKIATLRNSRGGDTPNVLMAALAAEQFGAEGITVHPRPDARHITYADVRELKANITTELNIEGYPSEDFIQMVLETNPAQVTLVPDPPEALTSNAGWDTVKNCSLLTDIIARFKKQGIRTSIFVDPCPDMVRAAVKTGTDRVELYTEAYATEFITDPHKAVKPFALAALAAQEVGFGVNAGHDLDAQNLKFFVQNIPNLLEVSIGHALISQALYLGLENTINIFRRCLDE